MTSPPRGADRGPGRGRVRSRRPQRPREAHGPRSRCRPAAARGGWPSGPGGGGSPGAGSRCCRRCAPPRSPPPAPRHRHRVGGGRPARHYARDDRSARRPRTGSRGASGEQREARPVRPSSRGRLRPTARCGPCDAATEMIDRPARVRMRSRKPCVFARRRLFGWKVRLLTVGLQDWSAQASGDQMCSRRGPSGPRPTTRGPPDSAASCDHGGRNVAAQDPVTVRIGTRHGQTRPRSRYQQVNGRRHAGGHCRCTGPLLVSCLVSPNGG